MQNTILRDTDTYAMHAHTYMRFGVVACEEYTPKSSLPARSYNLAATTLEMMAMIVILLIERV